MGKKKRIKKVYVYEVYAPMPYCEVYLVESTSKKEARRLFETNGPSDYQCIGEVASRRKQVHRKQG